MRLERRTDRVRLKGRLWVILIWELWKKNFPFPFSSAATTWNWGILHPVRKCTTWSGHMIVGHAPHPLQRASYCWFRIHSFVWFLKLIGCCFIRFQIHISMSSTFPETCKTWRNEIIFKVDSLRKGNWGEISVSDVSGESGWTLGHFWVIRPTLEFIFPSRKIQQRKIEEKLKKINASLEE